MRHAILFLVLIALAACKDDEQYTDTAVIALQPDTPITYQNTDSVWLSLNVVSPNDIQDIQLILEGTSSDTVLYSWTNQARAFSRDSLLFYLDEAWVDSLSLDLNIVVENEESSISYKRAVLYLQEPDTLLLIDSVNVYNTQTNDGPDAIVVGDLSNIKYNGDLAPLLKEASLTPDSLGYQWTALNGVQFGKASSTLDFDNLTSRSIQQAFYGVTLEDTVSGITARTSLISKVTKDEKEYFTLMYFSSIQDTLDGGEPQYYSVKLKQYVK